MPGLKILWSGDGSAKYGKRHLLRPAQKQAVAGNVGGGTVGITNLLVMEQDARVRREEWVGAFDRVLCDVPCSGFGVFAKKPELHYKNPAESERLPKIQADILDNASAYVKTGGKLVYSTCTLLPDENERNVAAFLERNDGFSLLEQRTLTPDRDGTDGFFYAVLIKR